MATFMQIVKEILEAEMGAGKLLEEIEQVKDSNESLVDKAKYLLLWYQEELNLGNAGNRMSLLCREMEVHAIVRDAEATATQVRENCEAIAEKVRKILKQNPHLIATTSAPSGFATTSALGEIIEAKPDLEEDIPSHTCVIPFRAWYFKNEAA